MLSVLVSSLVSPLFPLSIKVCWGNGDPVTRVGMLLQVLADTGIGIGVLLSVAIQPVCWLGCGCYCNNCLIVSDGNLNVALPQVTVIVVKW